MSAVERIQAAIDKLDKLKAESTPGPWASVGNGYIETVPEFDVDRFDTMGETVARVELLDADAELIVTLHRTIDAQLAILHHAVGHFPQFFMSSDVELNWLLKRPSSRDAVTLADAILGPDPH